MVDALLEEIEIWEKEEADKGHLKNEKSVSDANGRTHLPLVSK
jgi:hypothetical protein